MTDQREFLGALHLEGMTVREYRGVKQTKYQVEGTEDCVYTVHIPVPVQYTFQQILLLIQHLIMLISPTGTNEGNLYGPGTKGATMLGDILYAACCEGPDVAMKMLKDSDIEGELGRIIFTEDDYIG